MVQSETVVVSEPQIPLIDLASQKLKPGTDEWVSTCKAVRIALEDHGGFLVLFDEFDDKPNHIYASSKQLFDLPTQTKMQKTSDKPNHGYFGPGPLNPLFESHAIDNPVSLQVCQNFAHIMWPEGNDSFSGAVNAYASGLVELDRKVKRMVFESYGVDSQKCESFLESNNYTMRLYKYMTARKEEGEEGIGAHRDTTLFTILHQQMHGLELKNKHGQWVRVDASPSLFCVVAGDAFSVWSNDRIRPCTHKVTIKSKTSPRYSIGLLSYASGTLHPAEELVDEQHPIRYKPFNHYQYLASIYTKQALNSSQDRLKTYCGIEDIY
ncbi:hypothetical protein K1719_007197 [Acacia pycnantha]|nr:hypothetical protein K1719_007197 [Acacia pycnantha]